VTSRHEDDRGLGAVARVRGVRERDSLFGLQRASEEHHAHQVRADQLDETVQQHAASGAPHGQGLPEWAAQRRALMALAGAAHTAHDEVAAAARLKATAHGHWQRDRARLRAVEHLLELRAEARRADLARAEARELDDIGGQSWLRRREAAR
jgi:flagellar export protein FliJ